MSITGIWLQSVLIMLACLAFFFPWCLFTPICANRDSHLVLSVGCTDTEKQSLLCMINEDYICPVSASWTVKGRTW